MTITTKYLYLLYVTVLSIGLLSCSSSKNIGTEAMEYDRTEIAELKTSLKFKTHFGLKGDLDIRTTNISNSSLDLSNLLLYIEQSTSKKFKAYNLDDFEVNSNLKANSTIDLSLSLNETIESDFGRIADIYNVSIVFKSDKPLQNGEERNIYFISYDYKDK